MCTNENRGRYDRSKLRYPSGLTDEEWGVIGPLIPAAKKGGNRRTIDERAVVNGRMSILGTGCQWAALPRTCRRAARSTTTSAAGMTAALMRRYDEVSDLELSISWTPSNHLNARISARTDACAAETT
jgi:hypothetical protein